MNVIDTITAEQVEVGDLISILGDTVEVTSVSDDMENVIIEGNSLIEGDKVTHEVSFSAPIDIMGA